MSNRRLTESFANRARRHAGAPGAYAKRFALSLLTLVATLFPISSAVANADSNAYARTNLVSDMPGAAKTLDPNLTNAWGLSHSPYGPWWISDNGTGNASVYTGKGFSVLPAISIPAPSGGDGTPTGNVFNQAVFFNPHAFTISENGKSGPSLFMFATENGTIAGWNPVVDQPKTVIAVNRSMATDSLGDTGAIYKGLAIGFTNNHSYIYATNFRFGTVEMFDESFHLVKSFTDTQLTNTCVAVGQCYAPFGIQNIRGQLYVTYALQGAGKKDDQAGTGNGFVDVFNPDGSLQKHLIAHDSLNSPWGLALAPNNFGTFSGDLLVGNFGNGAIHAYNPITGALEGTLKDQSGNPLLVDGLWALAFGDGGIAGQRNQLFFTAGPAGESHGLFGKITTE